MADPDWQPHTVTDEVLVNPAPVSALRSLFDDGLPPLGIGDTLPPLWHWVALPQWTRSALMSRDGHPVRGSFLPPVDQPRRMFAGGEVMFEAPVEIGAVLRREATVTSVDRKHGRSGELVVVKVDSTLFDGDTICLTERQEIIYRGAAAPVSAVVAPEPAADIEQAPVPLRRRGDFAWEFRTDPSLLMRFSAATANAHRIHYDWPYATHVEGYPGLVVHGPLMTLALAEVARLEGVADIRVAAHRNFAPLFCGQLATTLRTSDEEATTTTIELANGDSTCTTLTLREGIDPLEKGNDHA